MIHFNVLLASSICIYESGRILGVDCERRSYPLPLERICLRTQRPPSACIPCGLSYGNVGDQIEDKRRPTPAWDYQQLQTYLRTTRSQLLLSPALVALVAVTAVAATPGSFEARDGASLDARGQFAKRDLHIAFHDPTGPVSPATQKEITKVLKKHISKSDQKKFPYCDANIGDGGSGQFRCFKTVAKKLGDQGPAGGFKV